MACWLERFNFAIFKAVPPKVLKAWLKEHNTSTPEVLLTQGVARVKANIAFDVYSNFPKLVSRNKPNIRWHLAARLSPAVRSTDHGRFRNFYTAVAYFTMYSLMRIFLCRFARPISIVLNF